MNFHIFGKYSNTPSADQSTSLSALTNNDLQIGFGTADNTGSEVNFAAANMKHVNGLAVVNLNGKTVPQTYYYDGNTGKASSIRAASTTTATVWPSVNFSSATIPYSASNTSSLKKYLAIVKPSTATTISTTATSGREAWSLSYNVSKNTSLSQSVTSSRLGYYLGWVYSYTGAVQTFNTPEAGTYKLEVWGAQGGCATGQPVPESNWGKGGYSCGIVKDFSIQNKLYVCVGGSGSTTGYNGGTKPYTLGGGGGGCTHIAANDNLGELANYINNKSYVFIVAGGGGGVDYGGTGGYGGGTNGGNGSGNTFGYGGTSTQGGKGYSENVSGNRDGSFGKGGFTYTSGYTDYSAAGGGGYYGGGCNSYFTQGAGGGGSGYVNTTVLTDASTIAGNTAFPSPSGSTETGHNGNGCAIITQVSY